jgi:eukaryotic-like serine/threonine-protein kinase
MAQQQQRYRVLEKIASGGMAEVFRAESAGLEGFKKTVAIKRVLPHLSEKKQFIGMFLDEARLSAHLSHSNCVQVFDIGVGDETYFIVMEYVDGADLKAIIEYGKKLGRGVPIEVACLICVRICEGLAYAHELKDGKGNNLGIVHRDMSPPNVLITKHGEVKIVDFGLAKAHSQLEKSEPGIIKGKFSYLSPEAALGQPIDARTDIFAVGIILWELIAGRRLFMGESDLDTVRQVQSARVPSIRQYNSNVTPEFEQVLARALARDPSQRYATAREFAADLTALLFHFGQPVSSFEIASVVQPVVAAREDQVRRDKKKSIIGSLIEQALFEFTSLQGGSGDRSSGNLGADPLSLGQGTDLADWARNLGYDGDRPSQVAVRSFEVGNLAALEEDTASGSRDRPPSIPAPPFVSQPHPQIPHGLSTTMPSHSTTLPANAPAPMSGPHSYATPQKSSGKGGLIAIVLLLLIAAGVAGAYFGGFIPPNLLPKSLLPR